MKSFELLLISAAAAVTALLLIAAADLNQAQQTICRSNLNDIYRMAQAYSADNDGYIVQMLERRDHRASFWSDRFVPYAKDFRNFSCPANTKRGAQAFKEDDLLPGRYATAYVSYGINGHISGRRNPDEKISRLRNPDYIIYFGDAQYLRLRSAIKKIWDQDYAPIHNNGMNALMADGHTGYFTRNTLGTFGKIPGWKHDPHRWRYFFSREKK